MWGSCITVPTACRTTSRERSRTCRKHAISDTLRRAGGPPSNLRSAHSVADGMSSGRMSLMNTRPLVVAPVLLAASLICAAAASAEDFWMLFQNQRVTISAKDVTVPKILDRWAQLGGTVVVNGDAVQGGPVTVQLVDVPEREALEILLRSVGGYIVAERTDAAEHASAIGRILILPTSPGQPRNVS